MAINWYPGHMHKANKEMTEILPQVDLVVELLDCRIPHSSQNPVIARLGAGKPCIKILSKSDLADPAITAQWQAYFESKASVKTLLSTLELSDKADRFMRLYHKLLPGKAGSGGKTLAMISGIPNVGKSTLINALVGRKVAKTGDEPAITRGLQRIKLNQEVTFLDTPGILWPKIDNENSGYRLAATGAIRDTAIDIEDVATHLGEFLVDHYGQRLQQRYALDCAATSALDLLEKVGKRRGCLRRGGHVDLEKVSSLLVNEFRDGLLGRITLETPSMIETEEQQVALKKAEKAAREAARKKKKRSGAGHGKQMVR